MKALTILQPWASLIACGAKRIETRSWATKYRGPLAIHAGKQWTMSTRELTYGDPFFKALWTSQAQIQMSPYNRTKTLPVGAVIAIADLVDVYEILHKHIPLKHPMEYFDQPEMSYKAMVYADEEKIMPIGEERFTVPAQKFTRPAGGKFKETWLCENEQEEFKDIGGDEEVFGHFAKGRYAWLLENVRPIEPIPARGMQGLWNWEEW